METQKFVVGKWYRIKKPVASDATAWGSVSRLAWRDTMDIYDGDIMKCRSTFSSGEHAFLDPTNICFHKHWVIGPYESREKAQTAMLNDAVKILEPIFKGATNCKVILDPTPVRHGGAYYGAKSKKVANRTYQDATLNGKKVISTDELDAYVKKALSSDAYKAGRDALIGDVYEIVKEYVGEMASAVALSSDKETKKLAEQLRCLKAELKNAHTERAVLYARNDISKDGIKKSITAVAEYTESVAEYAETTNGHIASDLNMIKNVVNTNAEKTEAGINSNVGSINLLQGALIDIAGAAADTSLILEDQVNGLADLLDDRLTAQNKEIKELKDEKEYFETYMEIMEDDLATFQNNLMKVIREQDQDRNVFEVGGVPYIIHGGKLWTCNPKKKERIWTTVTPSDVLVSDVQLKADMASIDSKAEEDINKLYAAFHERQKTRNEFVLRDKKELDKPKEAPVKKSFLKKALSSTGAKWTARAAGVTISASAGVAMAAYAASLLI